MEQLAEQAPDVFPSEEAREGYLSLWGECETVNALFLERPGDPSWSAWEPGAVESSARLVGLVEEALGGAGLFSGPGALADGGNAVWHASEGDWESAAWSLAAPGRGGTAGS